MEDNFAKYERLICDRPHPNVLRITITNGKMNQSDTLMQAELRTIWREIDIDPTINSVLVTGAGKVFSAGGEFADVQKTIDSYDFKVQSFKDARNLVYDMVDCSKPIVSAMRGVAVGQGLVIGMMADVTVATKSFRIIDGHTKIGVAAGDHGVAIWPLLTSLSKAKYYLMTCDELSGEEAERIGLITFAVEDDELDSRSMEIAVKLAEGPRDAIRMTKHTMNAWIRQASDAFDASLALEMLNFSGPDAQEGMNALLEKRDPVFNKS